MTKIPGRPDPRSPRARTRRVRPPTRLAAGRARPAGLIAALAGAFLACGATAAPRIDVLSHDVTEVTVDDLPGTGPPDVNGLVVIRVRNNGSGGDDGARLIRLRDVLPSGYAIDAGFAPIVENSGAGNGEVDSVLFVPDPAATPAGNAGTFHFYHDTGTSTGPFTNGINLDTGELDPLAPAGYHVLGKDSELSLTFRIVRLAQVDATRDPAVREETVANGLDPALPGPSRNDVRIDFTGDGPVPAPQPPTLDARRVAARAPDLDIDVVGPTSRIVAAAGATETVDVVVTNRGTARARDAAVTLALGKGWAPPGASSHPPGCAPPADGGDVYRYACALPPIPAGGSHVLRFDLAVANETGSLLFEAEVEGDINVTDAGGGLLGADTGLDYALDAIRKDYVGFRMDKTYVGSSEVFSSDAQREVQIGEDVFFRLDATWFGGGADPITGVTLTDRLPPGEGYVGDVVTQRPGDALLPLEATGTPPGTGTSGDPVRSGLVEWALADFRTDGLLDDGRFSSTLTARVLNVDTNAGGLRASQGDELVDELDGRFTFRGVDYDATRPDWPAVAERAQRVTVVTPDVTVSKEVCNASRGPCDPRTGAGFAIEVYGLAGDAVVYRVVVANTDTARAAAFDLEIDDTLNPKTSLVAFAGDGLDNDGDGLETVAVLGGEIDDPQEGDGDTGAGTTGFNFLDFPAGARNTSNAKVQTLSGRVPEVTTLTLGPGGIVVDGVGTSVNVDPPGERGELILSYRATVGPDATLGDVLPNTATVRFDTILGEVGSQTLPRGGNGEPHGARVASVDGEARILIGEPGTGPGGGVDIANSPGTAGFDDAGAADADPAGAITTTRVAAAGASATFDLFVANESGATQAFALAAWADAAGTVPLPPAGWSVAFRDASGATVTGTGELSGEPGSNVFAFEALVTTPADAAPGAITPVFFEVVSTADPAVTDVKQDAVQVAVPGAPLVVLAADQAATVAPCTGHAYYHELRNAGTESVPVRVRVASQDRLAHRLALPTGHAAQEPSGYATGASLAPGDPVAVYSAADAGWRSVALVDDGSGGVAVPLAPGDATRVQVTVLAGCDVASHTRDTLVLVAESVTGDQSAANRVLTTVSPVSARLVKRGALDADCDGAPDSAFVTAHLRAGPDECVVWEIEIANDGTESVCNVEIRDAAPAFTELNLATGPPAVAHEPAPGGGSCAVADPRLSCRVGNPLDIDADGADEPHCLRSGERAAIRFGVRLM